MPTDGSAATELEAPITLDGCYPLELPDSVPATLRVEAFGYRPASVAIKKSTMDAGQASVTLDGAVRMRVRVIDAQGKAHGDTVVRCRAQIHSREFVGIAERATDQGGIVVFEGLPYRARRIRFEAIEGDSIRAYRDFRFASAKTLDYSCELRCTDGPTLHGRVAYASGEPVVGARVEVLAGRVMARSISGADGDFSFDDRYTGPVTVRVVPLAERRGASFAPTQVGVELPRTDDLEIVVERGHAVTLIVRNHHGEPASRVPVALAGATLVFSRPTTFTDANGRAVVDGVPAAGGTALLSAHGWPFEVRLPPGQSEVAVEIPAPRRLTGWVKDSEGRFVEGAEINSTNFHKSARTDRLGRFLCERVRYGEGTLYVKYGGRTIRVALERDATQIEVVIPP